MGNCLYTSAELVEKIKEIDIILDSGVTRTDLDTGQSKQILTVSQAQLRKQRETYLAYLMKVDPACYKSFMPASVIQFGSNKCY